MSHVSSTDVPGGFEACFFCNKQTQHIFSCSHCVLANGLPTRYMVCSACFEEKCISCDHPQHRSDIRIDPELVSVLEEFDTLSEAFCGDILDVNSTVSQQNCDYAQIYSESMEVEALIGAPFGGAEEGLRCERKDCCTLNEQSIGRSWTTDAEPLQKARSSSASLTNFQAGDDVDISLASDIEVCAVAKLQPSSNSTRCRTGTVSEYAASEQTDHSGSKVSSELGLHQHAELCIEHVFQESTLLVDASACLQPPCKRSMDVEQYAKPSKRARSEWQASCGCNKRFDEMYVAYAASSSQSELSGVFNGTNTENPRRGRARRISRCDKDGREDREDTNNSDGPGGRLPSSGPSSSSSGESELLLCVLAGSRPHNRNTYDAVREYVEEHNLAPASPGWANDAWVLAHDLTEHSIEEEERSTFRQQNVIIRAQHVTTLQSFINRFWRRKKIQYIFRPTVQQVRVLRVITPDVVAIPTADAAVEPESAISTDEKILCEQCNMWYRPGQVHRCLQLRALTTKEAAWPSVGEIDEFECRKSFTGCNPFQFVG